MDGPVGFDDLQNLLGLFERRDRLTAGEAGVAFVPVTDFFLAKLPAKADIMAAMAAGEVNQTHLVIFQFASDFRQFIDVIFKMVHRQLKAILHFVLALWAAICEFLLKFDGIRMRPDDIAHDTLNQREGFVGLVEGETSAGTGGADGSWGKKLRTRHVNYRLSDKSLPGLERGDRVNWTRSSLFKLDYASAP
jgi:hypothetical protein